MLELYEVFDRINSKYPHVAKRLQMFWGVPGFYQQLSAILLDTRDGERRGFPQDDLVMFFELSTIHDRDFPHLVVSYEFNSLDREIG